MPVMEAGEMNRFKNILCVVEPVEACRPALERAVRLAENNQAGLTAACVIPRITAGIGMPDGLATPVMPEG